MKIRLIAAGLHFLGSVLVISIFLSVIYFVWYPEPFYIIHSVFDAVKIALIVDVVLGPFLTLVIFNVIKPRKELIRDISIIIMVQIMALTWGTYITYKMRPLFFVFQDDTFYPIIREEVDLENLNNDVSAPKFWQQPKTVYVEPLKGADAIQRMNDITNGAVITGDMYKTSRYKPFSMFIESEYRQDVVRQAMSYKVLLNSRTWKRGVVYLVESQGGGIEDYLFYPVENDRFFRGLIAFNKNDFSFAGLVSDL